MISQTSLFLSAFSAFSAVRFFWMTPMRHMTLLIGVSLILACSTLQAGAQKKVAKAPTEDDYYKLLRYELPKGEVLEAGAIEALPGGKIAVGTRRGEIWIIDNGLTGAPSQAKISRFAHGLHEVLGLAYHKNGWLYVTQRCDVSRLKDTD